MSVYCGSECISLYGFYSGCFQYYDIQNGLSLSVGMESKMLLTPHPPEISMFKSLRPVSE